MKGIDGLISSALKRHGILNQVNAALVVQSANAILDEIVEDSLRADSLVISFVNQDLKIACKHSAAVNYIKDLSNELKQELECKFPTITISSVNCWIDPDALDRPRFVV
ncbi:MAG: hypothetical protein Q8P30_04730 [Candidatus Uhrbacteria bacterium]|nr:hypothetical protein [Candidatus Uhrbacteria bacterium]